MKLKNQTINRKNERKVKNENKEAGIDIRALEREVYSYQFNFSRQHTWNPPITIPMFNNHDATERKTATTVNGGIHDEQETLNSHQRNS